ncbi:hypothetical protein HNQ07_004186 [Deinococcus metalli]|nr:hypothetical protein [Deinococcus metalli]
MGGRRRSSGPHGVLALPFLLPYWNGSGPPGDGSCLLRVKVNVLSFVGTGRLDPHRCMLDAPATACTITGRSAGGTRVTE